MDLQAVGKLVIIAGLSLAFVGVLLYLFGRVGWLGHLPGDISIRGGRVSVYFPIVTMIIVSVVLTVIANVILRIFR